MPERLRICLASAGVALCLSAWPVRAEPYRPAPPPSVPLHLDPDVTTCTPTRISDAFASHLTPWADQPPEVLAKLRQVQVEMTRASIARCVSLGHLSADQAAALERDLGLVGPAAQPASRP